MNITLAFLLSALVAVAPLAAQPELPYRVVENWPQLPADFTPGAAMGVAVDQAGAIWFYNRGSHPVIQLDKNGKVLQAWKEDVKKSNHATSAHGMRIGPDGGLWLVGRETNTVRKFSPDGRALIVIGGFSGRTGNNDARYAFNRPTAPAFDSKGNVYVADGYGNTRVVKYSPAGAYITHWGGKGTADGQFNLVHDVTVDSKDRIYVADRGNKRVQVFDVKGAFLAKWENIGVPWGLTYDARENVIFMCDGDNGRVSKLNLEGKLLGALGSDGEAPGQFHQAHAIAVDAEGSIYVGETVNARLQKFVRSRD